MSATSESLSWLPEVPADFAARLNAAGGAHPDLKALQQLAMTRLNLNQSTSLARKLEKLVSGGLDLAGLPSVRLAVFSPGTISIAAAAIPAAALRHGVATRVACVEYDRATTVALSGDDDLARFSPEFVLLAFDHRGLPFGSIAPGQPAAPIVDGVLSHLAMIRDSIRERFGSQVIFQTIAPPPTALFGSFDARLEGTWRTSIAAVNAGIVDLARQGSYVLDVEALVGRIGSERWYREQQWLGQKLPFDPAYAPIFADHVGRLLGAIRGRSRKCLVLDLDNTLWGGAIGDEGLGGIVLGQGSADGEAFLEVQRMALAYRDRGVTLAVCSKNDENNARAPFREHPEMLLKEEHISVFQANWIDKATNLEAIARQLNIGLDALVLLDDNPAERAQVRAALPMVATPEVGGDPSTYAWTIQAAGYFEAVSFSEEDRLRAASYAAEAQRVAVLAQARDLGDYLAQLNMTLSVAPFDSVGRSRIAQLINKSNQFNLTSRRYTEEEVAALETDASAHTLQARLKDRFGDSGMICVIVAREGVLRGEPALEIDSWLMSCRVLGRKVEEAMLSVLVGIARANGVRWIVGRYLPTPKNGMVREHYAKLGFSPADDHALDDPRGTTWMLDVGNYSVPALPMTIEQPIVAAAA